MLGLSDRAGPGQPWVRQGRAKSDPLALDPMRARPDHQNPVPTLALPLDSVWAAPSVANHNFDFSNIKFLNIVICDLKGV